MIVKLISSKKATGSFGGLSDYLQDKQNLHKDKVELVYFENCEFNTLDENISLIKATQSLTTSKADPTLHLVVSFQEDEKPTQEQLKDITHELLKSIDIEHHQRLCVTHDNTNNYHLHLAINRIDPDTYKRARLPFSKMKLQKKAAELEEKHFLQKDNHIPNWILAEQNRKTNDLNQEQEKQYEPIREQHNKTENRRLRISQSITNNFNSRTKTNKRDSMRKLSDIDMVHNKKLIKMLLLSNERNSVRGEEQRATDNQLRWERQGNSSNVGSRSNGVAKDIKSHTGISNLADWIKTEALDDLKAVLSNKNSNLEHLHTMLAKYNLELKERGNGLIIKDKNRNLFCKASDIDRKLSKSGIEKQYGDFMAMNIDIKPTIQFGTPKTKFWEEYRAEEQLKRDYKKEIQEINKKFREGLIIAKTHNWSNKKVKKETYDKIFNNKAKSLYEIEEKYKAIFAKKNIKNINYTTYKEYLTREVLKGNSEALATLRATAIKEAKIAKEDENTLGNKIDHKLFILQEPTITKQGFVVYKLDKKNDNSKIIDKGNHLKISNASDEALLKALEMARTKYGSTLDITGDDTFRSKVINLVHKHKLDIKFTDKGMQQTLETVNTKSSIQKENKPQGVTR
ncbi:putative DNA relaxase TraI [Sulfurovum sp. enrichment culture clone C5]|uniref:Putative DNA relaxase TraI n=1 Tax=Sulfurovum sp. enrichment culture clone C5 TaxID=497650 RepID=A0A0S4XPF9_9BACT|nr:putative DNA relaxase TraI [Sulfurovum sp. enrichment culture clone C5]